MGGGNTGGGPGKRGGIAGTIPGRGGGNPSGCGIIIPILEIEHSL